MKIKILSRRQQRNLQDLMNYSPLGNLELIARQFGISNSSFCNLSHDMVLEIGYFNDTSEEGLSPIQAAVYGKFYKGF